MKRRTLLLFATLMLSPMAFAGLLGARGDRMRSGVFEPARPAPGFVLQGSDETRVTLERFRGKVVILEFGFTHCPNVCPVTLANLANAFRELGPEANDVQLIFVTVDPKRDTVPRLREYLKLFNPNFIGATGPSTDLDAVTRELEAVRRAYGVLATEESADGSNGYQVHHSSSLYLIDRQGVLRGLVPFGKPASDIVHDIRLLLTQ
jgi:protein SCO1/2